MNKSKLIILRGQSGSGKSTIAKTLQVKERDKGNKLAWVEQDYFRRIVLKEKDTPGGFNIEFIKDSVLYLLKNKYDVVLEGIFDRDRYEEMFKEIILEHPQNNFFFYLDVSFDETLKRHSTKHNRNDFGEKEMKAWYKEGDYLKIVDENIIPEKYSLNESIKFIENISYRGYVSDYLLK